MTREQIIDEIIEAQIRKIGSDTSAAERESYLADQRRVLLERLTETDYIVCSDFDLDVLCCSSCHMYATYDMWDITLADGRHAWVCDPYRHILMRKICVKPSPDSREEMRLLDEIFGGANVPDPAVETLNAALQSARSDSEKVRLCLQYVHHFYGRIRGTLSIQELLRRNFRLIGSAPAIQAKIV
jgi:hypothetical protein